LQPVDLSLIDDLWVPNVFIYNLKTFKVREKYVTSCNTLYNHLIRKPVSRKVVKSSILGAKRQRPGAIGLGPRPRGLGQGGGGLGAMAARPGQRWALIMCCCFQNLRRGSSTNNGPCHVSGNFLPLKGFKGWRVNENSLSSQGPSSALFSPFAKESRSNDTARANIFTSPEITLASILHDICNEMDNFFRRSSKTQEWTPLIQ
jgi:hypothetical protein